MNGWMEWGREARRDGKILNVQSVGLELVSVPPKVLDWFLLNLSMIVAANTERIWRNFFRF